MSTIPEPRKIQMNDISKPSASKATNRSIQPAASASKLKSKTWLLVISILIVASLPTIYFYNKSQQAEKRLNDPNTSNLQVVNEVVNKVSRHILLPTGEQPTLATVSDINKVKGQPFFANAQNGDKVLVFTQARKAILYRPSKDIIIEVAPLNVGSLNTSTETKK